MTIKVGFAFSRADMPRTVFYEKFCEAVKALAAFTNDAASADLLFPAEDVSGETNWPRYARPETAYLRGRFDEKTHHDYLALLAGTNKPLCVVNMHPFIRVPLIMSDKNKVCVADANLLEPERIANPRTISMPALPITRGTYNAGAKQILASFRGVESHPCRRTLSQIHDGKSIIVELVDRQNHFGKIDAERNVVDGAYSDLLNRSVFAFVPRGEAEFSYRLLEVMSFGCIPIVISDGLILPFDRSIDWDRLCLRVPENDIANIKMMLAAISSEKVAKMQCEVVTAYKTYFANLETIADALVVEAGKVIEMASWRQAARRFFSRWYGPAESSTAAA